MCHCIYEKLENFNKNIFEDGNHIAQPRFEGGNHSPASVCSYDVLILVKI